jgi:hypothetical protein
MIDPKIAIFCPPLATPSRGKASLMSKSISVEELSAIHEELEFIYTNITASKKDEKPILFIFDRFDKFASRSEELEGHVKPIPEEENI